MGEGHLKAATMGKDTGGKREPGRGGAGSAEGGEPSPQPSSVASDSRGQSPLPCLCCLAHHRQAQQCHPGGCLVTHGAHPMPASLLLTHEALRHHWVFFILYLPRWPASQPGGQQQGKAQVPGELALGQQEPAAGLRGSEKAISRLRGGLCAQLMGGWQRQIAVYF